jgi:hypothetical protein
MRRRSERARGCQRTRSPACKSKAAAKGKGTLANKRVARPLNRMRWGAANLARGPEFEQQQCGEGIKNLKPAFQNPALRFWVLGHM